MKDDGGDKRGCLVEKSEKVTGGWKRDDGDGIGGGDSSTDMNGLSGRPEGVLTYGQLSWWTIRG